MAGLGVKDAAWSMGLAWEPGLLHVGGSPRRESVDKAHSYHVYANFLETTSTTEKQSSLQTAHRLVLKEAP